MDRSIEQKINKETEDLNNTINQLDLTVYIENPSNNRIHILLMCTWNILHDRSYIRPIKITLNKFEKVEII